ncbi:MAG: MIP/aquaporin family protein [Chthoniobacterales bacterium]
MVETIRATRPEPPPHVSAEIEVAHTPVPKWAIGEFFGTFLLVFFGCGSVCAAVATGAQVGVFQVAIVWGIGIPTAIYLTGSLSSAHLNPAVTIASAVWSRFPVRLVFPYILVQMIGAFAAAALLFSLFGSAIAGCEMRHGIVRGAARASFVSALPPGASGPGGLTVYLIAPVVGGLLGGEIYRIFFRPAYRS